jgi:hypothetical protein
MAGRTVLVTGGTTGIGRATALGLAAFLLTNLLWDLLPQPFGLPTGCGQPVGSANRLMARKWAATPTITSRWNNSW